jgi:predicted Holliday junction resolvase-like endonuclease
MAALVVALVVTLLIIVWLVASRVSYQAHHKYTEADLKVAREDSVSRSRSVVSGRVQEHLAPLFPEFISQFNPRDAIFLGTPLDFVVFDGLNDGDDTEVRRVVFVEVKTGKASLNKRERRVRDAIQAGRVEYQLLRLPKQIGEIASADDGVPALPPLSSQHG